MSGAMIDRCNANSAHHRAFITNPLSLSPPFYEIVTSYLREIPLRATLTSRSTISLFIIRGDLEIDSLRWTRGSLFFLFPIPTIRSYSLKIRSPFSLKQRIKLTLCTVSKRHLFSSNSSNKESLLFFPFFSFFSTYPNVSITEQKREKGRRRRRRREKEKEKLVKKVDTSNVTIQLVPL